MQLVSITPKNLWEEMFEQPIAMCLTHLVMKYPEYAEMIKNRPSNCYTLLDNSIVELGESVTLQNILDAAELTHADEIILRDAYPLGSPTRQRIKEDIEYLRENNLTNKYSIMAVCHGENLEEFKKTFNFINSIPEIDVIGIPKVLCRWLPSRSRAGLAPIFTQTDKQIHLLGSWFNLAEEIEWPVEYRDRIRSIDTCLPSYYVISGKDMEEDRDGTIDLEKEYPELTKERHDNIIKEYYNRYNKFGENKC